MRPNDFRSIGSMVEQEDGLMDVLSPRELLTFALKIKTNLSREDIKVRVNNLLERLDLTSCADQTIGPYLSPGVSSGERKRTSIGYELITNPTVLFLDEPTSGLDSNTAQKVIDTLRAEAKRGLTILFSIH